MFSLLELSTYLFSLSLQFLHFIQHRKANGFGVLLTVVFIINCQADEFPDLYGAINLEYPESIADQTFVITMGKSGTHLLLCSISAVTKRPIRTLFPDLPICTNLLDDESDFSKPTIYFGHDTSVLEQCKHNRNKLIATIRNYKENILSYLVLNHKITSLENENKLLEDLFLDEVLNEKSYFRIYIDLLLTFDSFPSDYRHLVYFEDLINHPENFLPKVLSFIGEQNCHYEKFIQNYDDFKEKLEKKYSLKGIDTGSRSDLNYFKKHISHEALKITDQYIEINYPLLWNQYLKDYAEPNTLPP